MSQKLRLTKYLVGLSLAVLTPVFAYAADTVDPVVIEAPKVQETSGNGFYLGLRGSAAQVNPIRFGLDSLAAVPATIESRYDTTYAGAIVLGFGHDAGAFGIRGELELGQMRSQIKSHEVFDQTSGASLGFFDGANAFGDTNVRYGLFNIAIEKKIGDFSPYVTAGLGNADVEFFNHGITLAAPALGLPAGDTTGLFTQSKGRAWQIGLGVGYQVTEAITLELGYRHFRVDNIEVFAADSTRSKIALVSDTALVGVRLGF